MVNLKSDMVVVVVKAGNYGYIKSNYMPLPSKRHKYGHLGYASRLKHAVTMFPSSTATA